MKVYTLFQYIFDIPVYPSKVLLALYVSPVSSAREIGEATGISRGKIYQTIQFLEKRGFVERERGVVKLDVDAIEARLREGIEELNRIADDLTILKQKAIEEKRAALLEELKTLERLEDKLRR